MPVLNYNRHNKSKRVTLQNQATTTQIKATTSVFGSAVNVSGYTEMIVYSSVIANASGTPTLNIQFSPDGGTTWALHTTLDADMTTTANKNVGVKVTNFGDYVRVSAGGTTTTSSARYKVTAVLKV